MITREEARVTVSMVPTHQYALGYNDAVETLFDSFEQHIKSLEAQLSNTEQLTCDGCGSKEKWKYNYFPQVCHFCKRMPELKDYHTPKDTK